MSTQKNELATLSPKQSNPYLASPTDFEVIGEAAGAFHGQDNAKLRKGGKARPDSPPSRATETSDAGKPHTEGMDRDEK